MNYLICYTFLGQSTFFTSWSNLIFKMGLTDLNYVHNTQSMTKLTVVLVTCLVVGELQAQDNTPKYSNEFLNLGVDARAFGMGMSMTAHVQDVSSGYWNPAGLNGLKADYQLELMHSAYFGGVANYDFGAFAARLNDESVLGLSVLRFAVDDIADTRLLFDANGAINYDNIQFFSAADYAAIFSYARQLQFLGGVDIGGNLKIIRRVVGDFAHSWGFGLDFGAQKAWNSWRFGLTGKDIFGTFNSWTIHEEELADIYSQTGNELVTQSMEVALPRIMLGVSRNLEIGERFDLLASFDLITTTDGKRNTLVKSDLISLDPVFGFEFGYNQLAFVRGGIGQFQQIKDFDGSTSWTFQPNAGVGFRIQEVSIDYAFTDIADQAAGLYAHVFSIKIDFNVED